MLLRNVKHDGAGLEQYQIAFLVRRDLPERLKRSIRRLLHFVERNEPNIIGLFHFFEGPTNAHVSCEPSSAIGGIFESRDGWDGKRLFHSLPLGSAYRSKNDCIKPK